MYYGSSRYHENAVDSWIESITLTDDLGISTSLIADTPSTISGQASAAIQQYILLHFGQDILQPDPHIVFPDQIVRCIFVCKKSRFRVVKKSMLVLANCTSKVVSTHLNLVISVCEQFPSLPSHPLTCWGHAHE